MSRAGISTEDCVDIMSEHSWICPDTHAISPVWLLYVITRLSGLLGAIMRLSGLLGTITRLSGLLGAITRLSGLLGAITRLSGLLGAITRLSGLLGAIMSPECVLHCMNGYFRV